MDKKIIVLMIIMVFGTAWAFIFMPPPEKQHPCTQLSATTEFWKHEYTNTMTLLELALMRIEIHKRQIKNLQAENDGLRTIIGNNPKLKRLIE